MAAVDIRLASQLSSVPRDEWDALLRPQDSPFLEWDWLASLEEAKCAEPDTGWGPRHLLLRSQGRLVAAVPLYLKGHSQGEFVFDQGWADAAMRARIPYYPKLLAAAPFTPATGRRLLTHPELERAPLLALLADSLRDVCRSSSMSSLHVNFCEPDEVAALSAAGFLHRTGVQYQWSNRAYAGFDGYLGDLTSKRRNQIRRERRDLLAAGIDVRVFEGESIPDELFEPMFRIYLTTIDKMYWGQQYLNLEFFELLRQRFKRHLCFVTAWRGSTLVAGTVNIQKAGVFYGRYWGTFEEVRNLHFEVCYYAGIEHCIARGHQRFEPGAGGDFKYLRGFDPTPTHSMHYLAHPGLAAAVAKFLERERTHVDESIAALRERSPLKSSARDEE